MKELKLGITGSQNTRGLGISKGKRFESHIKSDSDTLRGYLPALVKKLAMMVIMMEITSPYSRSPGTLHNCISPASPAITMTSDASTAIPPSTHRYSDNNCIAAETIALSAFTNGHGNL